MIEDSSQSFFLWCNSKYYAGLFLVWVPGILQCYCTLFRTVAAELFGSNLRATVATTVPNFARGTVIPLTSLFVLMKNYMGTIYSALIVGLLTYTLAILALIYLEEPFKKDINYVED